MRSLLIALIVFFLFSCDNNPSDPSGDIYLGSKSFSFTAQTDETTLEESSIIALYSVPETRDDTYTIESDADLAAFNLLVQESEQIVLTDLNLYTYFFFRGPGGSCGSNGYYKYSDSNYSAGTLTINMDHYKKTNNPEVLCPGVFVDSYYVFKAKKN